MLRHVLARSCTYVYRALNRVLERGKRPPDYRPASALSGFWTSQVGTAGSGSCACCRATNLRVAGHRSLDVVAKHKLRARRLRAVGSAVFMADVVGGDGPYHPGALGRALAGWGDGAACYRAARRAFSFPTRPASSPPGLGIRAPALRVACRAWRAPSSPCAANAGGAGGLGPRGAVTHRRWGGTWVTGGP